jgi:hypothetical protein
MEECFMLTTTPALRIPVQRPPVQVRPVFTHLAAQTNQLPLATLVYYGRRGEPRTLLAWECRCEEHFVHPASQEVCPACNTQRDEAPNATVRETLAAHPDDIPDMIRTIVEAAALQFDPALVEPPF